MKKGLKNNTKVENNLYNFSEEKERKKLQSHINSIISDIKKGKPIIVVDSKERENEGDLVLSAEKANIDNIAFCMRYARGLMCIPTTHKTINRLKIPMKKNMRSLNIATSVAIILAESLKQTKFI